MHRLPITPAVNTLNFSKRYTTRKNRCQNHEKNHQKIRASLLTTVYLPWLVEIRVRKYPLITITFLLSTQYKKPSVSAFFGCLIFVCADNAILITWNITKNHKTLCKISLWIVVGIKTDLLDWIKGPFTILKIYGGATSVARLVNTFK